MENSRGDDPPWFLASLGSVNYLRYVINELEVANFCLPAFTLDYITVSSLCSSGLLTTEYKLQ